VSTPVIGREGLLRLVGWAEKLRACNPAGGGASQALRARASSADGGADECSGRGAVGVVSGGDPERHSGIADHAPGAAGGLGRAGGGGHRGVSTMLPHEHGDGKIQGWHRDRLAVIYVRQSSRQQVLDHGESTRLQYGLTDRAAALGWPASRVMVIDEDLGRSAANAAERPGFARLVAELTMGHVGLVLGLEMSRLARAGRDWHQLIELCSLAGALLADADGVYDPNWYNDRLLLGLKGTMT